MLELQGYAPDHHVSSYEELGLTNKAKCQVGEDLDTKARLTTPCTGHLDVIFTAELPTEERVFSSSKHGLRCCFTQRPRVHDLSARANKYSKGQRTQEYNYGSL